MGDPDHLLVGGIEDIAAINGFNADEDIATSSLDNSPGVRGSMAETTTGLEPWILNPNSPKSVERKKDEEKANLKKLKLNGE